MPPAKRPKPKPRAKAKPKKPTNWSAILWTLLLVNCVCGSIWSQITRTTRVRVIGSTKDDEARIRDILQLLRDKPYMNVNKRMTESLVLGGSAVELANFNLNVFGRGILRIRQKIPVAKIGQSSQLFLSSHGDLFTANLNPKDQIGVQVDEGLGMNFSFMSGWEPGAVATLALKIKAELPPGNWRVQFKSGGNLWLNRGTGATIILGDSSQMDRKLRVLKGILASEPKIEETVKEINVTAPDRPVVRK